MIKLTGSTAEFKVSLDKNINFLSWMDKQINKGITHATAGSAAYTRENSAPDFWSKKYSKKDGNTSQVDLFSRFGANWANAKYKDGRRVVNFHLTLTQLRKEAVLTAPVMNMYENDAIIRVGNSKRKAEYTRPGTHIFASQINGNALIAVQKALQKFDEEVNKASKRGN